MASPGTTAPGSDKYLYYKHSDMSWAKLSVRKRISHRIVTLQELGKTKVFKGERTGTELTPNLKRDMGVDVR